MQDRLSARGFSLGYLGSGILLIFYLVLVQKPELFVLADAAIATKFHSLLPVFGGLVLAFLLLLDYLKTK